MNTTIRFPNLGLEFYSEKSISLFGFEIAYYGIIIASCMLIGALIAYKEAKRTGQNVNDYIDFTFYVPFSAITLFVFARKRKLNFWLLADTTTLGLVIGQAIGRWGNYFNREAFGGYTNNLFAMQIPVSEANGITTELLEHITIINGEAFIQVHPTFLYESLCSPTLFTLLTLPYLNLPISLLLSLFLIASALTFIIYNRVKLSRE